jgi:hypothetical protein
MGHNIKVDAPMIASYVNGNYNVELYADGTKIRFNDKDSLIPAFPENMDVCITKKCDGGCPYCYEGCTVNGQHGFIGDYEETMEEGSDPECPTYYYPFELPHWMQSLKPGTELAINGNNMDHPDLEECLKELRCRGIITNITINQRHLAQNFCKLVYWQERGWIHGIGISLSDATDPFLEVALNDLDNVVMHVIAGIFTTEDMMNLQSYKAKLLILGYKNLGRATEYSKKNYHNIMQRIEELKANLPMMRGLFEVMSFDNLALDQLDVKKVLFNNNEERWSQFYMGDDGGFTMYIDTVAGKYAKNSCMPQDERYDIGDKTVEEMFNHIRDLYGKR